MKEEWSSNAFCGKKSHCVVAQDVAQDVVTISRKTIRKLSDQSNYRQSLKKNGKTCIIWVCVKNYEVWVARPKKTWSWGKTEIESYSGLKR